MFSVRPQLRCNKHLYRCDRPFAELLLFEIVECEGRQLQVVFLMSHFICQSACLPSLVTVTDTSKVGQFDIISLYAIL